MTETALSSVGFDYRTAYTDSSDWSEIGHGNTLQRARTPDFLWRADRHDVKFAVSAEAASRVWFQLVLNDIVTLLNLRPNWNGYGERAVEPDTAVRLVQLLDAIDFRGPPPSIVPLANGGVQAEWHKGEASVEIEISPSGDAVAYASSVPTGDIEWVVDPGNGRRELALRMRELLSD